MKSKILPFSLLLVLSFSFFANVVLAVPTWDLAQTHGTDSQMGVTPPDEVLVKTNGYVLLISLGSGVGADLVVQVYDESDGSYVRELIYNGYDSHAGYTYAQQTFRVVYEDADNILIFMFEAYDDTTLYYRARLTVLSCDGESLSENADYNVFSHDRSGVETPDVYLSNIIKTDEGYLACGFVNFGDNHYVYLIMDAYTIIGPTAIKASTIYNTANFYGLPCMYHKTDSFNFVLAPGFSGYYDDESMLDTMYTTTSPASVAISYVDFDKDQPVITQVLSVSTGTGGELTQAAFAVYYTASNVLHLVSCYTNATNHYYDDTAFTGCEGVMYVDNPAGIHAVNFVTLKSGVYTQYTVSLNQDYSYLSSTDIELGDIESDISTAVSVRWPMSGWNIDTGSLIPWLGDYAVGYLGTTDGDGNYYVRVVERDFDPLLTAGYSDVNNTYSEPFANGTQAGMCYMLLKQIVADSDNYINEVAFGINATDANLSVGVYLSQSSASAISGANKLVYKGGTTVSNGSHGIKKITISTDDGINGYWLALVICDTNATHNPNVNFSVPEDDEPAGPTVVYYINNTGAVLPNPISGYDGVWRTADSAQGYYFQYALVDPGNNGDSSTITGTTGFNWTYTWTNSSSGSGDMAVNTSSPISGGLALFAQSQNIPIFEFGIIALLCSVIGSFLVLRMETEANVSMPFMFCLFVGWLGFWCYIGFLPWAMFVAIGSVIALMIALQIKKGI